MLSGFFRYIEEHWGFIGSFMAPALKSIFDNGADILTTAALDAVKQVAADPTVVTNADKRNKAVQAVADSLKAKGITAAENAVNIAVEAAVAQVKAAGAAGTPAPVP